MNNFFKWHEKLTWEFAKKFKLSKYQVTLLAWLEGFIVGYILCKFIFQIKIMTNSISWNCKHTWKQARINTAWCLLGCSIGDFGTIFYFQNIDHTWTTTSIMILAIINGLLTSIILETFILLKQMTFSKAIKTDSFKGKYQKNIFIYGENIKRVLLFGLGKKKDYSTDRA